MRIHNRQDIVDQVLARLKEPSRGPVILLCGRPGCGKTTALKSLAAELSKQPGIFLAHSAIREYSDPDNYSKTRNPRNFSPYEIIEALTEAAAQGMPGVVTGPDVVINMTAKTTGPISGSFEMGRIGVINLPEERDQVGRFTRVLKARRRQLAAGDVAPIIVVLIDALDDLENVAPGTYEMVEQFDALADDLADAGIRIVITAQKAPTWFNSDPIDVEATAPAEIHRYVEAELTTLAEASDIGLQVSSKPVWDLTRAIVRRADGLFIIAAGYLAEIARGNVPDDIWEPKALPDAATYFVGALTRMRKLKYWPDGTSATVMLDTERFLAILATTGFAMTEDQVERVWDIDEPIVATSRRWFRGARKNVLKGLAESYLKVTEEEGAHTRYALFHPTLRDAVVSVDHSHESISVQRERERYLRTLTPLFLTGLAWDPESRAVLREAPFVLADVMDEILAGAPSDPDADEWADRCATLVESWEWMECLLVWHDPSDEVPLGIEAVLAGLRRLARMNRPLELWATGHPRELARPLGALDRRPPRVKKGPAVPDPDKRERPRDGLAYTKHELISPLLTGTHRAVSEETAVNQLAELRRTFHVADKHAAEQPSGTVVLWVRGYMVTPEERAEGYLGNFMAVRPEQTGRHVAVRVHKLPIPVRQHPVYSRRKRSHPDWGVWVLRNAESPDGKKPHPYRTRAEAEASIDWLRDEYPSATSVPRQGRTGVMIYDRRGSKGPTPVRQFVLYVRRTEDGFVVVAESEEQAAPGDDEP